MRSVAQQTLCVTQASNLLAHTLPAHSAGTHSAGTRAGTLQARTPLAHVTGKKSASGSHTSLQA